jgi:hypothetical protein
LSFDFFSSSSSTHNTTQPPRHLMKRQREEKILGKMRWWWWKCFYVGKKIHLTSADCLTPRYTAFNLTPSVGFFHPIRNLLFFSPKKKKQPKAVWSALRSFHPWWKVSYFYRFSSFTRLLDSIHLPSNFLVAFVLCHVFSRIPNLNVFFHFY